MQWKFETSSIKEKVIVTDALTSQDQQHQLHAILKAKKIGVLARLTTNLNNSRGNGFIMIGYKKSGNPYNKQDIGIIEIIANELVIAIQSALRFEEIENFNLTLQKEIETATRKLRLTDQVGRSSLNYPNHDKYKKPAKNPG